MAKLLRYGLVVLLLVIVVAAGFLLTLDINQYKGDVVQAVKENTGREFKIDGDLKLALSLIPTIAVEGVSLGNADWGSKPDMVKASRFEARVAIIPLLGGNIKINKIILHNSEIFLETNKEGVGNWILARKTAAKAETGAATGTKETGIAELPGLAIEKIDVRKAKISYKDGKSGQIKTVNISKLTSKTQGWSNDMRVNLVAYYNKTPIKVDGTFGSLQHLIEDKPYPIDAAISAGKAAVLLEGKITHPARMEGINMNLSLKADTLKDFNKLIDGDLPALSPVAVTGTVTDDKGVYNLKPLQISFGESDLSGDISVALSGKRPLIKATLDSNRIDVTPFQSEEKKQQPKVFPNTPLPVAALQSVDAEVRFNAKQIITTGAVLNDVSLPLKLAGGHLSLSSLAARVADGTLMVKLDLLPVKSALRLNADINVKQLVPGKLPKLQEKKLIDEGKTDVVIKGKGTGKSVSEIMAGFNGQMLVQVGKGKLNNSTINFAGADLVKQTISTLNPASEDGNSTELQCGVINFKIKNGIATADKGIAFETDKMTIVGSGTVNLKTEGLDLGVRPYPREGVGINAGKFTQMVRMGGTLAEPKAKIDSVAALKTAVSTGAAVATLGLSLLAEGAYDRRTADEHPCDTALGKAPSKPATKTQQTTTQEKPGVIESTGDKVKGVFKGLFGK